MVFVGRRQQFPVTGMVFRDTGLAIGRTGLAFEKTEPALRKTVLAFEETQMAFEETELVCRVTGVVFGKTELCLPALRAEEPGMGKDIPPLAPPAQPTAWRHWSRRPRRRAEFPRALRPG